MNFDAGSTVVADDVTDVARVQNLYCLHKFIEQHALQVAGVALAAKIHGIRAVVVRPGIVYGGARGGIPASFFGTAVKSGAPQMVGEISDGLISGRS